MLRVVVLSLRKPLRSLPVGNVPSFRQPIVGTSQLSVLAAQRLDTKSREQDQVGDLYVFGDFY